MSTNRRTLAAKRLPASSENAVGKAATGAPRIAAKKRPPLTNLTNQRRGSVRNASSTASSTVTRAVKTKKASYEVPVFLNAKPNATIRQTPSLSNRNETEKQINDACIPMDTSSSMDEPESSYGSMRSSDVEFLDENDLAGSNSIQNKAVVYPQRTEQIGTTESLCKRHIVSEIGTVHDIVNLNENSKDPQTVSTYACDIYRHLRASEAKKRPSTDFIEKIQQDITATMRSVLVDWLVEVAEEYRIVPDTLYLTINYVDRYLSGNSITRQNLQLLGITCMMIAAKYEEICAPHLEEYCYITDNTYVKDEVLQMESLVLRHLKFELTAPTTKCFLRRFVHAAQAGNEGSPLLLDCLSNYLAELALLDYNMLQYAPSLTASSAIFLAKFILTPSKRPWSSTLQHYTMYEASNLQDCVLALHQLCLNANNSTLPAIREKYSQHKYKSVAKKYCPPTIPPEYFCDANRS